MRAPKEDTPLRIVERKQGDQIHEIYHDTTGIPDEELARWGCVRTAEGGVRWMNEQELRARFPHDMEKRP